MGNLTPDSLVLGLLAFIAGGSATGLALISLPFVLYSWFSFAKDVKERGHQLGNLSRGLRAWMRSTDPVARRLAVVSAILLLLAQAVWLVTTYVVGNVVSVMFEYNKNINQAPGAPFPTLRQMLHALQFDPVSGSYLAIALVGLVISYRVAVRTGDRDGGEAFGCLLAIPGYASVALGLFFLVSTWFLKDVAHDPGYTTREIWLSLLATVVGLIYAASCHLVLITPARVVSLRNAKSRQWAGSW